MRMKGRKIEEWSVEVICKKWKPKSRYVEAEVRGRDGTLHGESLKV